MQVIEGSIYLVDHRKIIYVLEKKNKKQHLLQQYFSVVYEGGCVWPTM